jgi:hypothetical protein
MERGYQYVSNNTPDAGYEFYKLSGDGGALFNNALFPLMISLNVPKSVVTKYQIGAGFPSQAPEDRSVTFYDAEDLEIGADTHSGKSFSLGEVREFQVSPAASVSKVVLAITKIPLNVARDSTATRVNAHGVIEVVPPNTPRFNYDPVTLEPLGLLIEPQAENLISTSNISIWLKIGVNVSSSISIFANPIYCIQGNGATRDHFTVIPITRVSVDTLRTLSIYMKNATNRFAEISVGEDTIFAIFDLELGVLETKHDSVQASIVPAGDGW